MTDDKNQRPDVGQADTVTDDFPDYFPELDPDSPEYDPEAAKKLAEAGEKFIKAQEHLREALGGTIGQALSVMVSSNLDMQNTIKDILDERISATATAAAEIRKSIRQASEAISGSYSKFMPAAKSLVHTFATAAIFAQRLQKELDELTPYLEAELQKPEYAGKSMTELFEAADDPDAHNLIMQALDAAEKARRADEGRQQLPHTAAKRAQTVEYPLDKPNSIIWKLLEEDTKGQIEFNLAKHGTNKDILAFYSINFEGLGNDLKITKRLLPFDKRVYIAISALFNAGNNVITLSQIHYAMGNIGRPSVNQLEKINDAITKMTGAKIFFDNQQEAETLKGYARFKYDGSLLPLERGTAIVNGQIADAAIHIFREPPLISFAKQRRQITTIEVKLLQSPLSKTDANLLIDDYLLERISKAKNGKSKSCRILLKTLFDHTDIKTTKQKQRAPEKVKAYLDYYQQCAFISRYTMEDDGITVYWK